MSAVMDHCNDCIALDKLALVQLGLLGWSSWMGQGGYPSQVKSSCH